MSFYDILRLSLRNLREARLRATLTSMGVIVGVAVIVTMVSFGLGLQRNLLSRFKALDLFNEIRVFGKNVFAMAVSGVDPKLKRDTNPGDRRGPALRPDKNPSRILDDAAIAEIEKIPGVAYVEPDIGFTAFVRSNGRVLPLSVAGVSVPTLSSRFKDFAAGKMLSQPDGDEAVVGEVFIESFGFQKPEDAVGQTIEFLTTPDKKDNGSPNARAAGDEEQSGLSFFGIPLEDENSGAGDNTVVARTFHISGILKAEPKNQGPAGLMSNASIYIPVHAAHEWASKHPNPMGEVALALARQSGQLKQSESEGYFSAVIRVNDPVVLTEVRKRLTEMGFGSFSIVDQLEQIRTVFLIIDSVLGLLGGISLLVASFGIANTMIMSILERTREIGIMKAIGCLAAWGIDGLANRLAYRFILKPQGASFIDFFHLPPWLWMGAILFALGVSILAALYPAARAARIDPVRALRHD